MNRVLTTIAKLYILYFLMTVIITEVNWIELNLFGVSGLYLSLYYINTLKGKSNESIQ